MTLENLESPHFEEYYKSVVPPRHLNVSLEQVDSRLQPIIKSSIDSLSTDKPYGLLLMGNVGCGKTSILAIVFRERLKQIEAKLDIPEYQPISPYIDIRLITHTQLINQLRDSVGETEAERHAILHSSESRIVLLDDLGRGFDDKSGWNIKRQEEYFDYRWKHSLPTFISTNLTPKKLRHWQGWSSIVDRIADKDWIIPVVVPGKSRRT